MFLWIVVRNIHLAIYNWKEGDIRLVDGSSSNQGRLEIYHNNQWGTICHDGFDKTDGRTACRQLGYRDIDKYVCCGSLGGHGTGPIWLEGLICSSNAYNLAECTHKGWNNTDCHHGEDVGVICEGNLLDIYNILWHYLNEISLTFKLRFMYSIIRIITTFFDIILKILLSIYRSKCLHNS